MKATTGPASAVEARFAAGRYIRAVNFHLTPRRRATVLETELALLAARFAPVGEHDLLELCATGDWPHPRPGVIVSFYNGYREHAEVVAPILERVGLVGWFFVPTAFVDAPAAGQRSFAAEHMLALGHAEPTGRRLALSWEDVRALADRHVVASHTRTHRALAPDLSQLEIELEISGSKRDLEQRIDRPVRSFAWLYGGSLGVDPRVDRALARSGYELLFANHKIERLS